MITKNMSAVIIIILLLLELHSFLQKLPTTLFETFLEKTKSSCVSYFTSAGSSEVLLVEELRNLLSDMFSPLAVVASDVLEPLILNNITGEKWNQCCCCCCFNSVVLICTFF